MHNLGKETQMGSRNWLFALWAVLGLACHVYGQAQSGTVVGIVTDQAGAVVPNATVTILNEGTRLTRVVRTNENGQYVAYSFPTGQITVTAECPGFQKLVRSGIQLTAADTLTVDLRLTVGNVQETVEVTGEAPLLQSQTAAVSTLINNQQMLEMPLNGRSLTQLLQLGTGAAPQNPGLPTGLSGYQMRANNSVSVNGSVWNNNSFLIDGMFDRGLWLNGLTIVPTIDSIQEMRVMAANYSAEYGAAAGAVTVVQTKSGTNQFHGDAYEFLRNDHLDANNFFSNRAGLVKPHFRRNEFGGVLGGPIRRDKTFIFGDYQGIRLAQPTTTVSTIPSLAQRQMVSTGDFSSLSAPIYDPYSSPAGSQPRAQFPGNRIPIQMIDPVAIKLMNLLPAPTSSSATRNLTFNPATTERVDQFDVRADQNLGSSDRLFFKYSYDNSSSLGTGSIPAPPNPSVPLSAYLTGGSTNTLKNWSASANYTKVFSAAIVNEARAGAVRWNSAFVTANDPYNIATALGIPGLNISDTSRGIPGYQMSGFTTIGDTAQSPEFARTISYQIADTLTWVKGSHAVKFGGSYIRHDFNGHTAIAPRGWYTFNGQFTRQIGGSGGSVLADFALGAFATVTRSIQNGFFGMRYWEGSLFAEDAWRATNRLTITYGMRYELQAPPHEVNNRWTNFDVATGRFLQNGANGLGSALRTLDTNNLAPRLGIAYMLTSDRKTVLRTGAGISYVEAYNAGKQLHQDPPLTISQLLTADINAAPPFTIAAGLPLPPTPDLSHPEIYSGNVIAFDQHLRDAKAMQWSFGIQRELISNLMLDVAYVGSRTLDMINSMNANQALPGPGALNPRRPLYSLDPLLGDVDYRTNWGASKYHSLQVNLVTRYAKGLTASLAWTWSHNLANARGPSTSVQPQNDRCSACEWSNALEDRRHMVVINHVYELPFGAGRQFANQGLLAHIVGNWNISGIWSMYTGASFGPSLATSVSNGQSSNPAVSAIERPNRVGDGNLPAGQRTIDHWFDTSAFAIPAQFTFGNSGLLILEGPGYFNVDAGIHRDFPVREGMKLTFRWEMFNAFNRANFTNPDQNAPGAAPNSGNGAQIGTATAGTISSAYPARSMQLSLKLVF
jgi:hypothetical protein